MRILPRYQWPIVEKTIARELQENARILDIHLSVLLGHSRKILYHRLRELHKRGAIRGYHADLNPKSFGYQIEFYMIVGLDKQDEKSLKDFEDSLPPFVRECHMIRNGGDFLLKFIAVNRRHMDDLTMQFTRMPNVRNIKTLPKIHTTFKKGAVPPD